MRTIGENWGYGVASGRDAGQGDFDPGSPLENDLDTDLDKAALSPRPRPSTW
ncbi:hypothetical protein ACWEP4_15865 [Streptomyces sp. NPDC004227]